MLRLQKTVTDDKRDLLIERYERLRAWALQLTEHDVEQAQELLQDFFIHFTVSQTKLSSIHELDNYLFVVMRNLHLSQVRSASRTSQRALSIVEFDSAEVGLWAADPRDRIRMQDQLRAVCRYACLRKESSKAGSVLILRFFHGYYAEEIAQILRVSRPSVKEHLRLARAEARTYLDDPDRLMFLQNTETPLPANTVSTRGVEDFSTELRNTIFNSRQGECPATAQLQNFYDEAGELVPDCKMLAHIVSCADCLDKVNRLLDLPLLASRYTVDTLGRDTRRKGGPGQGGGGATGSGPGKSFVGRYLRRAKQIIRHEPKELSVAVNGYLQGSQKISSERNELTLVVDNAEAIGFVEVFSEQGIRLLLLNVDPLPGGAVKQSEHVELSEGRTIDASLSFSTAWPTINVLYHDPTLNEKAASLEVNAPPASAASSTVDAKSLRSLKSFWRRMSRSLLAGSVWFRPGFVTAVVAFLLIGATVTLLLKRTPVVPSRALDILAQAKKSEQKRTSQPGLVTHRTLFVEEWLASQLRSRRRIELWQKGATEVSARRVYDTDGHLLNGEWQRADGSRLLFNHGERLRSGQPQDLSALTSAEAWRATPSADEFAALISSRNGAPLQIEERPNSFILWFADHSASSGLIEGRLAINRADYRTIGETLIFRENGETHEYRFTEGDYERESVTDVAPSVFEPDPALLSGATRVVTPLEPPKNNDANPSHSPASAAVASLELEVDVLKKLNQVNALSGEQIALTRTPAGQLRVQGIVDTEERKAEVFRALASAKNDPAVVIQVETVNEAAARQSRAGSSNATEVTSVDVESKTSIPAGADLLEYFSNQGLRAGQLDEAIRRFADRVLAHSREARRQALALKQIAARFSAADLQRLDKPTRDKWRAMVAQRAQLFKQEVEGLRRELQPIFANVSATGGETSAPITNDADLALQAKRIFDLALTIDENVSRSFSIYMTNQGTAPVKTAQFAHMLNKAEASATSVAAAAQP